MARSVDGTPYNRNKPYHKPIMKMLNDPLVKGKIGVEEVFFLDDKADNFISSPGNGITIPRYEPSPNPISIMADDQALLQLQQWLSRPEVMEAPDVRYLDKTHIFTTPTFSMYSTPLFSTTPVLRSMSVLA